MATSTTRRRAAPWLLVASSTDYTAGTVRPNELIARLDPAGGICVTVGESATHLVLDVTRHDG